MNWKDIVKKDKVDYMTPEQEKEYQKFKFEREKREYEDDITNEKGREKYFKEQQKNESQGAESFKCGCALDYEGMPPEHSLEYYPCDKAKQGKECAFSIEMAKRKKS